MALTTEQTLQQLYIGYLGRPADRGGLDYWIEVIDTGRATLDDVRTNFVFHQPEYARVYGGLNRAETVTKIYENLFERQFDPAGFDYWVNGEGAAVQPDNLIAALIAGAGPGDSQVLANKGEIARLYTDNVGASYDLSSAYAIVADVNRDPQSVAEAETLIGTAVIYMNQNGAHGTPLIGMMQSQPNVAEVVNVAGNVGSPDIFLFSPNNFDLSGDVVRLTNFELHDQLFLDNDYAFRKNLAPSTGNAAQLEVFLEQAGSDVLMSVESTPAGAHAAAPELVQIVIVGADVDDILPA